MKLYCLLPQNKTVHYKRQTFHHKTRNHRLLFKIIQFDLGRSWWILNYTCKCKRCQAVLWKWRKLFTAWTQPICQQLSFFFMGINFIKLIFAGIQMFPQPAVYRKAKSRLLWGLNNTLSVFYMWHSPCGTQFCFVIDSMNFSLWIKM